LVFNNINLMEMKERLIQFLAYLKIGQNAFEKKVGLSIGSISGAKKGMRTDNLAKIAALYPELNLRWLLLGEGPMLIEKSKEQEEKSKINEETFAELLDYNRTLRNIVNDMRSQIAELKDSKMA